MNMMLSIRNLWFIAISVPDSAPTRKIDPASIRNLLAKIRWYPWWMRRWMKRPPSRKPGLWKRRPWPSRF